MLAEHYDNRRAGGDGVRARVHAAVRRRLRQRDGASRPADTFRHDAPTALDYRFILRGSKGPIPDREPAQLYARACVLGWPAPAGARSDQVRVTADPDGDQPMLASGTVFRRQDQMVGHDVREAVAKRRIADGQCSIYADHRRLCILTHRRALPAQRTNE